MSGASALKVSEASEAQWDALVGSFPQGTVYHTVGWLQAIAASYGARPLLVKAEDAGRCVAAWPCLWLRKGPLRVIGSPLPGWSTPYMGPLVSVDVDAAQAIGAMLESDLLRHSFFACRTMHHLPARQELDLSALRFERVNRFETYWIDLTKDEQAIWAGFTGKCRTHIRKAEKSGFEVRAEDDPEGGFLDEFWQMSVETFARARLQPTYTRQFCVEVWKRLHPLGRIRAFSAFARGKRAGTLVIPVDQHTMYYWAGASRQEYRGSSMNNLLLWEAIKNGKASGLRGCDLVSNKGGPGKFKQAFGPQTVESAHHWERSSSWLIRMLRQRYEAFLRKRRRVDAPEDAAS